MKVSGAGIVYTNLHVPEPVQLSLDYWHAKRPTPKFSKGRGFAAVVIAPAERGAQSYIAARIPQPSGIDQKHVSLGPDLCHLDKVCDVPAGHYRLYLVTEGKVTVDLRLQGLAGSSHVEASTPAVGEVSRETESYYHSTPDGLVQIAAHGAGFSPELTGESNMLFTMFWFHGPTEDAGPPPIDRPLLQVGDAGSCFYDGPPPADAYVPGCPGGRERANISTWRALSDFQYLQWGSSSNIGAGEYGWGYFAVHSGIRDPGFVGFWLDIT
ncbi:MAG: hypothetical protein M3323_03950 [Actinomycetota bacterium]|nr:hypothetical protein [Actinomycetota bacterium]